MKQRGKFHHPNLWPEARLHHCIWQSFRVPDQTPSSLSRRHQRRHHCSKRDYTMVADSILQGEGETISRRHERGCVLRGSGRAYHGVTRDSVSLMAAGEPITAARVIRYLSCHEDRLYHGGKRASMSIVAASNAARDRVPGGLW